jgi:hypothetical protein
MAILPGVAVDDRAFDTLTRSLATPSTRRDLLRRLRVLPGLGALTALLAVETDAARPEKCTLKPRKQLCQGRCGIVRNCAKKVDCGSKCKACQKCNHNGRCVPDAKQERKCCAGTNGKKWCDAGKCVAIPRSARATVRECGGRCDNCPDPGCDPDTGPASTRICGVTRKCADCLTGCLSVKCPSAGIGDGPEGNGWYCLEDVGPGPACVDSHNECPRPADQICTFMGGFGCQDICFPD